jgi:hypothetical protein
VTPAKRVPHLALSEKIGIKKTRIQEDQELSKEKIWIAGSITLLYAGCEYLPR